MAHNLRGRRNDRGAPSSLILEGGTSRCLKVLEGIRDQGPMAMQDSLPKAINEILELMADTLARLAYEHLDREEGLSRAPWRFCFWPGYDTVLLQESVNRFSLRESHDELEFKSGRVYCDCCVGRGVERRCEECQGVSLTGVAFSYALSDHPEDKLNGKHFTPGSTHRWLSNMTAQLAIDETPLFYLTVGLHPPLGGGSSEKAHLKVPLKSERGAFGQELSTVLSDPQIIRCEKWPVPLLGGSEPDIGESRLAHEIRKRLYDIWLSATFAEDTNALENSIAGLRAFVEERIASLELDSSSLDGLLKRVESIAPSRWPKKPFWRPDPFRVWANIAFHPIPTPANISAPGTIGSAMFLSTHKLSDEFMRAARSWIQFIFLTIRNFETACLSGESGIELAFEAFAHEVKKLAGPLNKRWLRPVGDFFEVRGLQDGTNRPLVRLGSIEFDESAASIASAMLFAPVGRIATSLGTLLQFWSMSDRLVDLPFALQRLNTFESLVAQCWQVAREILIVHALKGEPMEDLRDIQAVKRLLDTMLRIFGENAPKCCCDCESLELRGTVGLSDSHLPWLARLLTAIFSNCIQHGNPIQSPTVELVPLRDGQYQLEVRNSWMPPRSILSTAIRERYALDSAFCANLCRVISAGSVGQGQLFKVANTRKTVGLCLDQLGGGKIIFWPESRSEPDAKTTIQMKLGDKNANSTRR